VDRYLLGEETKYYRSTPAKEASPELRGKKVQPLKIQHGFKRFGSSDKGGKVGYNQIVEYCAEFHQKGE